MASKAWAELVLDAWHATAIAPVDAPAEQIINLSVIFYAGDDAHDGEIWDHPDWMRIQLMTVVIAAEAQSTY